MNEQKELEFLVQVAEDRIGFFDECELEAFPPNYPDDWRNILKALARGITVEHKWKETISQATDVAQRNMTKLWERFRLKDGTFDQGYIDSLIKKHFSNDLYGFMIHDGGNLVFPLYKIRHHIGTAAELEKIGGWPFEIDPQFSVECAKQINNLSRKIARMCGHPWRLIRYLSLTKLNIPIEYSQVNLGQRMIDVAEVLSGRFDARIFYELGHETPLRKSIVIEGKDISILADEGLIWSIIYNNLKNSQKKFDVDEDAHISPSGLWEGDDYRKYLASLDRERVSYASCHNLNDDYIAIVFSDSGSALDINRMITNIRKEMLRKDADSIDWVSPEMRKRITAWSDNDYAFNLITMEDITNVAFMARMKGTEMPSEISSGMGLYGTRYIVERLGGAILYTTTFRDENPVFTYILPREPKASRKGAQVLRKNMIHGKQLVA